MELNSVITRFIEQNSVALQEIYIKHEMEFNFPGTGVMLVEFDMVASAVQVNYIPYDIAITEMDEQSVQRLKKNKTLAECSSSGICECATCDTRPKAVYFFLNVEGRNLLVEAEIKKL